MDSADSAADGMPANPKQSFPGRGHVYDVAIVGGGPSGCEAAWACTRAGLDTLLVTTSMDTIYNLIGDGWRLEPPSGTLMADLHAEVADADGWVSTWAFHRAAKQALEHRERLHVLQSNVSTLLTDAGAQSGHGSGSAPGGEGERVTGVATWEGVDRNARTVVLAVGSFLSPQLHIGDVTESAGRLSEMAYDDLYEDLRGHGFGFETVELRTEAGDGSLPYEVVCRVFAASEADGHALVRLPGLYATGLCLRGELSFEAAAADGRELGRNLGRALKPPGRS